MQANPSPMNTVDFPTSEEISRKKLPKGLRIRNGNIYFNFKLKGQYVQDSTGLPDYKIKAAEKALELKRAEILAGKVIDTSKRVGKILFRDFMALAWSNPKGGYPLCSWEDAQVIMGEDRKAKKEVQSRIGYKLYGASETKATRLKPLLAFFGKMRIANIEIEDLKAYKEARKINSIAFSGKSGRKKITEGCMNRETAAFHGLWKRGLRTKDFRDKQKLYPSPYDAEDLKGKEPAPKKFYLDELKIGIFTDSALAIAKMFSFPGQLFIDITLFLIHTGLRVENALLLQVGQIDWAKGNLGYMLIEEMQVKCPDNPWLPFHYEKAVAIAKKYCEGKTGTDFLFTWDSCRKFVNTGNGVEYGSYKHVFDKVMEQYLLSKESGIREFGIHSGLRKTYAMNRRIDGADTAEVSAELFHKDIITTKRYLDESFIRAEKEKRAKEKLNGMQIVCKNQKF